MTNASLMKVESIAECSLWSILQYFDLHIGIIVPEKHFFWSFLETESGRFTQVLLYKQIRQFFLLKHQAMAFVLAINFEILS